MEWSDLLSSGNDEIDSQHKSILILLDKLILAHDSSKMTSEFTIAFIEFNEAVQKHFAYEETLLAKLNYKGLKNHQAGHEEIADLLNSISMLIILDEKNIPFSSIERLVKWFDQHIMNEDVKFFSNLTS